MTMTSENQSRQSSSLSVGRSGGHLVSPPSGPLDVFHSNTHGGSAGSRLRDVDQLKAYL